MGEAEGEGAPPMSQTSTFQSGGSVSVFTMKPVVGATGAEAVRSAARCKTEVLPAPSKPRQRTLASYHTTARAAQLRSPCGSRCVVQWRHSLGLGLSQPQKILYSAILIAV